MGKDIHPVPVSRSLPPQPSPEHLPPASHPSLRAAGPRPVPPGYKCWRRRSGRGGAGAIAMQSALFLAVQHGGRMERGGRRRSEAEEAEKGRMKRTIIKDWKTRLSYFLQNSSNSNKRKSKKAGKHRNYFRPSPEEAQLWSEAFDELLANKYGLAAFRAFLKSEFCEENIEFWLACEDFKKTKSPQKLTSKAKKIYNDFIEKEAPKEINIDFQTKNMIAQNIQEATHTCFSAAQKRVYSLMENNSYPRFLESEFYQELCKKTPITRAAQGT